MRKGTKFMNIDILSAMKGIVDTHVKHYQSDFAYDIAALKEAALKKERAERIFVWMCRKSGTWLLKEKDVFPPCHVFSRLCSYILSCLF